MRTAPILALFLLFFAPTEARAADPPPHIAIRLLYDVGPGVQECPDERGFRYALQAKFGYDPTEPPVIFGFEAPPLLRVVISREGAQLRAVVRYATASARMLYGDEYQDRISCTELVEKVSLMIHVGIGVSAPPASALPPPAPPPVLPPVVGAMPPPPPSAPPRSPWPKVRAGLGTGTAFGVAPGVAVGFSAQVGIRWPAASVSFEGRADLPVVSEALGIRTSMVVGTLLPCGHAFKYGVLCGLLSVGERRSSLIVEPSHASAVYVGAGGRLGIEVPFAGDRLVARLSGDLVGSVQPSKVRMGIAKVETWTTPAVSGGPSVGLLVNF